MSTNAVMISAVSRPSAALLVTVYRESLRTDRRDSRALSVLRPPRQRRARWYLCSTLYRGGIARTTPLARAGSG